MPCKGTCTVRIHESRDLKPSRWPAGMDEATARRFLESLVKKETEEFTESGCESGPCRCVPLADYMPGEGGKRKKEPEWTVWRLVDAIDRVETGDGKYEHIFGTVEIRSAIVPGLCEKAVLLKPHESPAGGADKPPKKE